jgi:8-oxo-dGTP pyrophosphatase MutT (NUDIX family)
MALLYRFNGSTVEVLLHKHKYPDEHGNVVWLGPGGKVDHGEHESEALVREVWEETGISLVYDVLTGYKYDDMRLEMLVPKYVTRINLPNGDVLADHVYVIEVPVSNTPLEPERPDMELGWYKVDKVLLNDFNLYSDTRRQIRNLWEISYHIQLARLYEAESGREVYERL